MKVLKESGWKGKGGRGKEKRKREMTKILTNYDFPIKGQLGFQDPATPVMEAIVNFHNYTMLYLVFVITGVLWVLTEVVRRYNSHRTLIAHKYMVHGTILEIIWTITPAIVLIGIAFPSFKLLYLMDEVIDPAITIKAIGHQWYWSYEYSDYIHQDGTRVEFDSYMVGVNDLEEGGLRLLEVDNKIVVPSNTHVRVIVTAADVVHSWAVPSLGIKIDGIPGRLNQTNFVATREGVYYGQCSELCGVNHAFMPIAVEVTDIPRYCEYMVKLIEENRG